MGKTEKNAEGLTANEEHCIDEIMEVIPQSYPFLMIDRVTDMSKGEYVDAYKNLSANEPFFQGHFKDAPVMPGVLVIEALAQAGAFCLLYESRSGGKVPFLAGVEKFKFKDVARPGDRLDLHVEMISQKNDFGMVKAEAKIEGKVIAKGEMLFCMMDKKEAVGRQSGRKRG